MSGANWQLAHVSKAIPGATFVSVANKIYDNSMEDGWMVKLNHFSCLVSIQPHFSFQYEILTEMKDNQNPIKYCTDFMIITFFWPVDDDDRCTVIMIR